VNKGPTAYDRRAELKIEDSAAAILAAVAEELCAG
jgi:hypothetical protein